MDGDFRRGRTLTMRQGIGAEALRILEIGALDKPIARRSDGEVVYVDVVTDDRLREMHAGNARVDPASLVPVDALWGERRLAECVDRGNGFDLVIASHVAEHVPDLIGWLGEIEEVLKPEGELRLALPDCRFSADALRRETGLGDLLANHVMGARRPTVANVVDFWVHHAPRMDGWGRYEGRYSMAGLRPERSLREAIAAGERVRDDPDAYVDVHCWVFQPRSFARAMARLAEEGLVRFACGRLIDPVMPLLEFYAFLRPCRDPAAAAASWRRAADAAADPVEGSAEARIASLEAALMAAEDAMRVVKASTCWKITAPLRWIGGRIA